MRRSTIDTLFDDQPTIKSILNKQPEAGESPAVDESAEVGSYERALEAPDAGDRKKAFVLLADVGEYSHATYGAGPATATRQSKPRQSKPRQSKPNMQRTTVRIERPVAVEASGRARAVSRLGGIAGFFILISFFLPWVSVKCNGREFAQQSGLQVMTGGVETSMKGAKSGGADLTPSGGWWLALVLFASIAGAVMVLLVGAGKVNLRVPAVAAGGVVLLGLILTMVVLPARMKVSGAEFKSAAKKAITKSFQGAVSQRLTSRNYVYSTSMEYGYWIALLFGAMYTGAAGFLMTVSEEELTEGEAIGPPPL